MTGKPIKESTLQAFMNRGLIEAGATLHENVDLSIGEKAVLLQQLAVPNINAVGNDIVEPSRWRRFLRWLGTFWRRG